MAALVVVCPPLLAAGFRLAGPAVRVADTPEETLDAVTAATGGNRRGVIAVHPQLWTALPRGTREEWQRRTDPLVLPLPDDSGDAGLDRQSALRELLAHAVGYEITFGSEEASP